MAAARQKEMKVSITEEATTSLTRFDCGFEMLCLVAIILLKHFIARVHLVRHAL